MKTIFIPIAVMVSSMLLASVCAENPGNDIKVKIEGEWVASEGTSNGEAPPPGFLEKMNFEFKDGFYRFNNSNKTEYTIDVTKDPAYIDIKNSRKQVGIIKLVDGKLHICTGVDGERPSEFSTSPGTNQTYLVLVRKH